MMARRRGNGNVIERTDGRMDVKRCVVFSFGEFVVDAVVVYFVYGGCGAV